MRRTITLVAVAALFAGLAPSASALTSWQTFGSATSATRGTFGYADANVHSTTKGHPEWVQIKFDDKGFTKRSELYWDIFCWRESDFASWSRSAEGTYHLPHTLRWDVPGWVDYCEVDASATRFDGPVYLSAVAQAKY